MTVKVDRHGLTVQAARPHISQTITFTGTSAQSAAFYVNEGGGYDVNNAPLPTTTTHVRLIASAACWIAFGASPVAVPSTSPAIYLPPGAPEYFWVRPGEKIAVIQDSGTGTLNIAELAN